MLDAIAPLDRITLRANEVKTLLVGHGLHNAGVDGGAVRPGGVGRESLPRTANQRDSATADLS